MSEMINAAQNAGGLLNQMDIGIFNIDKVEFYMTEGGFTGLRHDGNDYPHITLRRTLPIGRPMEYISVADHENKEIGIIRSVEDLEAAQKEIVTNELNHRYYCPHIIDIHSVKDKLGYVYMELRLRTAQGREHTKSCAVKDVNRNIRMLDENSLIIFDVDGNRYIVPSLAALDKKSVKQLEPFLF